MLFDAVTWISRSRRVENEQSLKGFKFYVYLARKSAGPSYRYFSRNWRIQLGSIRRRSNNWVFRRWRLVFVRFDEPPKRARMSVNTGPPYIGLTNHSRANNGRECTESKARLGHVEPRDPHVWRFLDILLVVRPRSRAPGPVITWTP